MARCAKRPASARRVGCAAFPGCAGQPLTIGEKQLVEIARTLEQESRIVILDEPNSALNEAESRRLFDIIRRLRARGLTIVYVSHRLEEVFAIADRITVLRDGCYQGTYSTSDTTIAEIITAMIGRPLGNSFLQKSKETTPGQVSLEVIELRQGNRLGPISFKARAGEIVGFAGLEGPAWTVFQGLFGLVRITGGRILIRGQPYQPASPWRRCGRAAPDSSEPPRAGADDGLVGRATRHVDSWASSSIGWVSSTGGRFCRTTHRYVCQLGIVTANESQKVVNLSGGNQQKVLLAKWLTPNQ
jgi:ribose transport system ATP-binding protein